MGYQNNVLVVFLVNGKMDIRSGGQILPIGSIPICIIDANNGRITEIINDRSKDEIISFVKQDEYIRYICDADIENFEYIVC